MVSPHDHPSPCPPIPNRMRNMFAWAARRACGNFARFVNKLSRARAYNFRFLNFPFPRKVSGRCCCVDSVYEYWRCVVSSCCSFQNFPSLDRMCSVASAADKLLAKLPPMGRSALCPNAISELSVRGNIEQIQFANSLKLQHAPMDGETKCRFFVICL